MASDAITEPRPARRSDPRGDARCQTPAGIPRQLRAPLDPSQQVPEGYVYVEFKKRVAKMDELRESKGGARSN
ncbi:hypothetical protein FDECE_12357 [Fusarium decemcellulare]|nr:hypothetical protein FDECE_12357 [Fusarium decemcellulare]